MTDKGISKYSMSIKFSRSQSNKLDQVPMLLMSYGENDLEPASPFDHQRGFLDACFCNHRKIPLLKVQIIQGNIQDSQSVKLHIKSVFEAGTFQRLD